MIIMIEAFKKAAPLLKKIEDAGFEAYFVGGSVRDYLLNKEIDDVDIATSATPEEVKNIFPKTIDVGIQHGTVIVIFNSVPYEITTFRAESDYEDFRRPKKVSFIRSLEEDLKRRDFTMNAIAMNRFGKIIDPFNGRKDLESHVIQTVGEPKDRFSEDALRMMRAVRFVSQLSFSIEENTLKALEEYGHLLKNISVERIAAEFDKILLGKNRKKAFSLLVESGLYKYMPKLEGKKEELLKFSKLPEIYSLTVEEYWTLILYVFNVNENEIFPFMRQWKQSTSRMKRVKSGMKWLNYRIENDWSEESLYEANEELAVSTEKLYQTIHGYKDESSIHNLKEKINQFPIHSRKDLKVSGKDLMDWFDKRGGPWVEQLFQKIEMGVLTGQVKNDEQSIREWLFSCNQN